MYIVVRKWNIFRCGDVAVTSLQRKFWHVTTMVIMAIIVIYSIRPTDGRRDNHIHLEQWRIQNIKYRNCTAKSENSDIDRNQLNSADLRYHRLDKSNVYVFLNGFNSDCHFGRSSLKTRKSILSGILSKIGKHRTKYRNFSTFAVRQLCSCGFYRAFLNVYCYYNIWYTIIEIYIHHMSKSTFVIFYTVVTTYKRFIYIVHNLKNIMFL